MVSTASATCNAIGSSPSCANCKGRRGLHAHHVVWRKHGGATTAENLVTLCVRRHTLVHKDFLDVEVTHGAAARGGPRFVFRDAHARPVERRDLLGVRPLAQCALDEQPARPEFELSAAVFGPRAPHGVFASRDVTRGRLHRQGRPAPSSRLALRPRRSPPTLTP